MRIPNVPLLSFNSGELSPQIDARSDVAKYASGCRIMENMIPRIYGGAERRPGTQYIDSCVYSLPLTLTHTIAISTAAQVQLIGSGGEYPLNGAYYLTADIDLTSIANFVPIGTLAAPFTGTLDGCGYTISNLIINNSTIAYNGLFGYCSNATLYNLEIEDADITATLGGNPSWIGVLAGYITNTTIVKRVRVTGVITGVSYMGGMIGQCNHANVVIDNCKALVDATASAGTPCGLFVGCSAGTISNCYAYGDISSVMVNYAGGFAALDQLATTFINCVVGGTMTAPAKDSPIQGGGFIGELLQAGTSFKNCYYQSTLNAKPFGGTDEQQTLTTTVNASSGHWHFTFDGITSGVIAYNGTEADIQIQLDAAFGDDVIQVSGGSTANMIFTFRKQYSRMNVATATIDETALVGQTWSIATSQAYAYPTSTTTPVRLLEVSEPDNTVRMVPFTYSSSISYELAFGPNYAKAYYNGASLSGDTLAEIGTPYLAEHIFELQFKQIADTMWITHPSYPPAKLTRTSATTFALTVIPFTNGPFLTRNDISEGDGVTLECSVTAKAAEGILTASSAMFTEDHIGALFKLTHPRTLTTVTDTGTATTHVSTAMFIKGTYSFITHGTWTGTIKLQRNETGLSGDWEDYRTYVGVGDKNISFSGTEELDNVQYRMWIEAGATGFSAELSGSDSTWSGIVRIDSIVSTKKAIVTVLSTLDSTTATTRWYEGAWSYAQGFSVSVTFFEERCCYAGNGYSWQSGTGDYEDFEEGINDADSFTLRIPTTNEIKWIDSVESLLVGTSGDEYLIYSGTLGEPLTPTKFSVKKQTSYGSSAIQSLQVNDTILFIDRVGRKTRELVYSDTVEKYVAPDLTALAEHITKSGIVSWAFQRNPDSIVWCVLADGTLLSITYEREQDVVAWAKHPMDGLVQSVSVIPGLTEDEVWLSVTRTVGGVDATYIERMAPRTFATKADAFFVDAGITYSGVAATTITGLTHLTGETVEVHADGIDIGTKVVSATGTITLSTAASKVQAGLPHTYKLQPMRLDITTQGQSRGMIKRINELVISFLDTLDAKYGDSTSDLYDIDWAAEENLPVGTAPTLFTGDITVNFAGGFSVDDPIIISGSGTMPCCVRAIVPKVEVTE